MDEPRAQTFEGRAKPLGAYPHLRFAGRLVFVSGTSSRQPDNTIAGAEMGTDGAVQLDIGAQTRACIENIGHILGEAGMGLADIVDITTFLVDMDHFAEYNAAYGEFFDSTGPARTTVAVRELPHPHLLIEIKATALRPEEHQSGSTARS